MFYETYSTKYTIEDGKTVNTNSLVAYLWIGFAICVFSNICSVILAQIHESVIEHSSHSEVKEKSNEMKRLAKSSRDQENSEMDDKEDK